MPYSNNIITAPVGLADIANALGTTSQDLGTLCTHTAIDKWARYKPVNHSALGYVTEQERKALNFGLSASTFQMAGACSLPAYAWNYTRPSGRYRAFDFVKMNGSTPSTTIGYKRESVAPCRGFYSGSDTGQLTAYQYYTQQQTQNAINVYAITTGDDYGIGLAEMGGIADYYFALAVEVDSSHTYVITSAQNIGAGASDPTITGWQSITIPTDSNIFSGDAVYPAYVLLCNQCHTSWWQEQSSVSHPLYYYALPVTDPAMAEITFRVNVTTYHAWCSSAWRNTGASYPDNQKVWYEISGKNTTQYAVSLDSITVELVYAATMEDVWSSTTIIDTDTYSTGVSIPATGTGSTILYPPSGSTVYLGGSQVPGASEGELWVRVKGIKNGAQVFSSYTGVSDTLPRD